MISVHQLEAVDDAQRLLTEALNKAEEPLTKALGIVRKLQGEIQQALDGNVESEWENTIRGGDARRNLVILKDAETWIEKAATSIEEAEKATCIEEARNFLSEL